MIIERIVRIYATSTGREPFTEWYDSLKDKTVRRRVRNRLKRLKLGYFGDCEPVGEGVLELRFFFGSGLRVYFSEHKTGPILLLYAGNKHTQPEDIQKAKAYWQDYRERKNGRI